ncbi:C6 zinc finger domain protein [Xylariaceae sp. FL1272]|nr:C6 zinc finger domain protein [Xylariaceae sp. FL1272]
MSSDEGRTPPKRRKVRKGTRSCWECKRRKAKCVFADAEDENAICLGCQQRRTPCVSQELPEHLAPARLGNRHLGHRISRVEDFMKTFLAGQVAPAGYHTEPPSLSAHLPVSPESLQNPSPNSLSCFATDSDNINENTDPTTRQLLKALPSDRDVTLLLQESLIPALYALLLNTQPYSELTYERLTAHISNAEVPGPHTHPVVLAKQMLLFALTLQSPARENLAVLSEPLDPLMHRLVDAATTWVTTKEEMQGTVDGLLCIMLEGIYEANSGNLRRSWLAFRRAMSVAQLMGLHRSRAPISALKRIDPTLDVKPAFLWYRIVYMDRYLCLMLGLPQGSHDKSIGAPAALLGEPPLGQFERRLTVIASYVLDRNEDSPFVHDIASTRSIDSELLMVAKSMPTSFWRPANFHNQMPGSAESLLETVRLVAQVNYYSLLVHLHLPFLLHFGDSAGDAYSKVTCVNASREIMTRFITHRTFNPLSSCSRPVDFIALIASMTLLLAHLDTHYHPDTPNYLAHHRLSDRALLDQALERMDAISNANDDPITTKSAVLIRRLLEIEEDAANGATYSTEKIPVHANTAIDGSETKSLEPDDQALCLPIPFLGIIKIARLGTISLESFHKISSIPPQPAVEKGSGAAADGELAGLQRSPSIHDNVNMSPSIAASISDWAFQGVDAAFFDSVLLGMPYDGGLSEQQ